MSRAEKRLVRCAEEGDGAGLVEALETGALVDWVDREGWAALHYAAAAGNVEMAHLLLAYSADANSRSQAPGDEGATPLHLAAYIGNTDTMRLLLNGGAEREATDQRGKTAVHWAALQGRLESLRVLENHGCDLRARVSGRGTALHYAAAFGDLDVVEWLVERGVDTSHKDKNRWLARDVAKKNGHKHVHQFLKSLDARQPKRSSSKTRKHHDSPRYPATPSPPPPRKASRSRSNASRGDATDEEGVKGSSHFTPQPSPLSTHHRHNTTTASLNPATTKDNNNTRKKKGWANLRSKSVGAKAGLRQQMEELRERVEDQEQLIQAKNEHISRLQESIFSTELEKVKIAEELTKIKTKSEAERSEMSRERRVLEREPATVSLQVQGRAQDPTAARREEVLQPWLREQLQEAEERLEYERRQRMQEREESQRQLEEVEARLEAEQRARASEQEASKLKVAALTSQLEEAMTKMKKFGVRQRKVLRKDRAIEVVDCSAVGAPSGLPNLGNTCYINSIIQCLYSVASVREYFTTDSYRRDARSSGGEGGEAADAVAAVFKALSSGLQREIEAKANHVKAVVSSLENKFSSPHQHDPHDLLCYLLTWLHYDLCQSDGNSAISQLFFGAHDSSITCRWTGEEVASVTEEFCTISLEVAEEDQTSLQALVEGHYRPQNTERHCQYCARTHLCRHHLSLIHLPPLLVIHLSRRTEEQLKVKVNFPAHEFMLQNAGCESPCYKLFGVVAYQGTPNSGNYVAFCRSPHDSWYCYDDDDVSSVSLQGVLNDTTGHILFYSAEKIVQQDQD